MKENLKDMKIMKSKLFETRIELAKENKTQPWKMVHLEAVLKALKKNKSRDPNGWVNELFQDGVIGDNLKFSLLHIFNKIKEVNHIPEFVRMADVSTIYKRQRTKN